MNEQLSMRFYRPPKLLSFGCVQIRMAHRLPLATVFHWVRDGKSVGITFFGKGDEEGDDEGGSFVAVQAYRLPGGLAVFEEDVAFFAEDRKTRTRLPEGVKFEPELLRAMGIPASWQHEAFCRSPRDVIHTYRSSRYALLIRYRGMGGPMLDDELFRQINRNLHFAEGQWEQAEPAWELRKIKPLARERALTASVRKEIDESIRRAYTRLGLESAVTPMIAQKAIHDAVGRVIASPKRPRKKEVEDMAIDLGCLWGQTLCDALKWHWCRLAYADGSSCFAITNASGSHAIAPMQYMLRQLSQRAGEADNTTLLLFNMVREQAIGAAPAKAYQMLG